MKTIRIGKDIAINWRITTNNQDLSLEGRDLYLVLIWPDGQSTQIINYEITDNNLIRFGLRGTELTQLGCYSLTIWENKGELGQTVLDSGNIFKLVKSTLDEHD